jgi:fumarylacetoacetase
VVLVGPRPDMTFGLDNLPYGSLVGRDGERIAAVRLGDEALDLRHVDGSLFADGSLDAFLAAGPQAWADVRGAAAALLEADALRLLPLADCRPVLAFTVADYVDFYASEQHAATAGLILRPGTDPLPENWRHLPVGYHGRSGSVVVSGTSVRRPSGMLGAQEFGPTQRLDFEAELAFVVGVAGSEIAVSDADEHVFGVCLLNDWSARDIQRFETRPLGPFLGKSFATSASPWITPLAALAGARVAPVQDPQPLPHLRDTDPPHGLALDLEVRVNGTVVSRPGFAGMYWTYAQMLAHLTSNGSSVRTGDLFASGTVSGPGADDAGCLLELTLDGTRPIALDDGSSRTWLQDRDEVVISGRAGRLSLGDVSGQVNRG